MATEDKPPDETGKGDENPLPVAKPVPTQPTIEPVAPVEPIVPRGELTAQPAQPAQPQATGEPDPVPEPLLVRIIEDDELSTVERKTIRYGKLGIFVAFLAFVAGCVTGYFIWKQFGEMAKQTSILAASFEKQKQDSADAAITTKQQIQLLQWQLDQQKGSFRLDERPWILTLPSGCVSLSEPV